uniref:Uncharacterized protein n=1 Tax=Oryza rufipogon TaxID=4529 RepID=A0A0E0Q869_ORYRU
MHDAALQALPMVLEWLKNKKLKTTADVDMQQLTSQRDNDNGSTPLHLAASMAGLPSLGSKSAVPSATRLLPDANVSTATPYTLLRRSAGSMEAVKALLEKCPDCATLRDARGRTFLHAAVENKSYVVVRHVVRRSSELSSILNLQDDKGDTALHSAVRLDMRNKEGMMPADVSWSMMPLETYYAWVSNDILLGAISVC